MIVKMKKVTLLVSSKYRDDALNELKKIGIMHIHYVKNPASPDIQTIESEIDNANKALNIIGGGEKKDVLKSEKSGKETVKEIINSAKTKYSLKRELEELFEQKRWYDKWGAVSKESINELNEKGITVRFYSAPKKALKKIDDKKIIHIVNDGKSDADFAFFSYSEDEKLDFKEEYMPEAEYKSLLSGIENNENKIKEINGKINSLKGAEKLISEYKTELEKQLEFDKVKHSMGGEADIIYLQGFCPAKSAPEFKEAAGNNGWAYAIEAPDNPEEVPTLIKTPKIVSIISPVFKFMGTVPGYSEYDISLWFLVFFSVFFALLVGDAGYGVILLAGTVFLHKKVKNIPPQPVFLMYVLSGATVIWGTLTGTWFGYERIAQLPFFNIFVINNINSFIDSNQFFMIYLCFIIGAVHLTAAHAIAAFRYINSLRALSEFGWMLILWGVFFIAGKLVIDRPLPDFALILVYIGCGLVLLFSNPQKNFIKGILLTLTDLPLKVIGSFSDIVSYLRLFAVGYATVVVAVSFNEMCADIGTGSVIAGLVAAVVLFIGHLINIALALMSVVVHGIRLNMLEFCGHLNMQWSGKEYKPFKN